MYAFSLKDYLLFIQNEFLSAVSIAEQLQGMYWILFYFILFTSKHISTPTHFIK